MNTYDTDTAVCVDTSSVENPDNYVEVIETVISSLDQYDDAMVNTTDEGHIWKFKYGSVDVFVQLTGSGAEDSFTVWSPVLTLPVENEHQLFRKLMEMNWLATFEARFGVFNQQVVVVATRTVADLSPGEVARLITVVATIADDNDESLVAEFPAAKA